MNLLDCHWEAKQARTQAPSWKKSKISEIWAMMKERRKTTTKRKRRMMNVEGKGRIDQRKGKIKARKERKKVVLPLPKRALESNSEWEEEGVIITTITTLERRQLP